MEIYSPASSHARRLTLVSCLCLQVEPEREERRKSDVRVNISGLPG